MNQSQTIQIQSPSRSFTRKRVVIGCGVVVLLGLLVWAANSPSDPLVIPDVTKPWSTTAVKISDNRPLLQRIQFWHRPTLSFRFYHQIDGEPEIRIYYRHLPPDQNPRVIDDLSRAKGRYYYVEPEYPGGSVRVEYKPKDAKSGSLYADVTIE